MWGAALALPSLLGTGVVAPAPVVNAALEMGNTTVASAVVVGVAANNDGRGATPGGTGTTVGDATSHTIHYKRLDANTTDWALHLFGSA